jgi:hypothetical protein
MLNQARNTPLKDGELVPVPLAAGAKVYAGALFVIAASGFGQGGAAATGLVAFGRAEEDADNTDGADGDKSVLVRRGKAFKWENSAGDPIGQAGLGRTCYIEDDETVAATDGAGTLSPAGTVVEIDEDGIWVL